MYKELKAHLENIDTLLRQLVAYTSLLDDIDTRAYETTLTNLLNELDIDQPSLKDVTERKS